MYIKQMVAFIVIVVV